MDGCRSSAALPPASLAAVARAAPRAARPGPTPPARRTTAPGSPASSRPTPSSTSRSVGGATASSTCGWTPATRWSCEGYDGEPYLRFRADGTVQENQNSPATYLNRNRYAGAEVPEAIARRRPPAPGLEDRRQRRPARLARPPHPLHGQGPVGRRAACPRASRSSGAAGSRSPSTATTVVVHGNYRLLDAAEPAALDRPRPWSSPPRSSFAGRRRPVLVAGAALLVGGVARARRGLGAERAPSRPAPARRRSPSPCPWWRS